MNLYLNNIIISAASSAAIIVMLSISAMASPAPEPSWKPKSSERLVKLPMTYLKKSIDHDFIESKLGQALGETENNINLKGKTLIDLQGAIKQAEDPEIQMELQHQLLNEKRKFVDLMGRKNELKRKKVDIKLKMLEDMMEKLAPGEGRISSERAALIEKQTAARNRFSKSLENIDMQIFTSQSAPQSRYSEKYSENRQALEKLMRRIRNHDASQAPVDDNGVPVSKSDYVRHMITDTQAELALINQEDAILGYMARLVGLDAIGLSEQAMEQEIEPNNIPGDAGAAGAVDYFLGN